MQHDIREPWEAWALVPVIIGVVAIPIITGHIILELYYKIKPMKKPEKISLANLGDNSGNDFFKKLAVGWIVCGPVFYWLYESNLF